MAAYVCLVVLALGLVTLVWGNYWATIQIGSAEPPLVVGVTFVALAAIVIIVSAIRSLWLYPLN
jgi:hypothetical protein